MNTKERLQVMQEIEEANKKHVDEWKNRNKIRGVLVDVEAGTVTEKIIDKNLDSCYETLNCQCIDIAHRRIDGIPFDIICDDEGILTSDPIPSAFQTDGSCALFGNLFVVAFDGIEDVRSLTDDEIKHVLSAVRIVIRAGGKPPKGMSYKALSGVDY